MANALLPFLKICTARSRSRATSWSVRRARPAKALGRCKGVAVLLSQTPCRSGRPFASRGGVQSSGAAVASVVLNGTGRLLAEPQLTVQGLADDDDRSIEDAIEAIVDVLDRMSKSDRKDDDEVAEAVRLAVRRSFRQSVGKRPMTKVHVTRL